MDLCKVSVLREDYRMFSRNECGDLNISRGKQSNLYDMHRVKPVQSQDLGKDWRQLRINNDFQDAS